MSNRKWKKAGACDGPIHQGHLKGREVWSTANGTGWFALLKNRVKKAKLSSELA